VAAAGLTAEGLQAADAAIDATMAPLADARMNLEDADLIQAEFRNAAAMLRFACALGGAELEGVGGGMTTPASIISEHRRLWLARNRPGGLIDSLARLERGST
jgi:hypothetical protein